MQRRSFLQTAAIPLIATSIKKAYSANDSIRLGIIGTGGRGQQLLKTLTHIPGFRIGAVCDLKPDRIEKALAICEGYYADVKSYTDFRQMLDGEKLDACIVATEVGNHGKCVIPVLERGLHCFSEKPMESTVEKVDRIVDAARKAKGIYQVGFQRRYAPGFQQAIQKIHEGVAGEVRFLQGHWHWDWSESGWCLDAVLSGGELVEQACHHMDVMQWVMKGRHPVRCVAMGLSSFDEPAPSGHPSEDHSSVSFQFQDGVVFSYTQIFDTCTQFTGEKLWLYGSKGGVDLIEGMFYPKPDTGKATRIGEKSSGWTYGTPYELEAFGQHIRNNEIPLSNVETARTSTLMSIMGRKAMYKFDTKSFTPTVVTWDDLNSTTSI